MKWTEVQKKLFRVARKQKRTPEEDRALLEADHTVTNTEGCNYLQTIVLNSSWTDDDIALCERMVHDGAPLELQKFRCHRTSLFRGVAGNHVAKRAIVNIRKLHWLLDHGCHRIVTKINAEDDWDTSGCVTSTFLHLIHVILNAAPEETFALFRRMVDMGIMTNQITQPEKFHPSMVADSENVLNLFDQNVDFDYTRSALPRTRIWSVEDTSFDTALDYWRFHFERDPTVFQRFVDEIEMVELYGDFATSCAFECLAFLRNVIGTEAFSRLKDRYYRDHRLDFQLEEYPEGVQAVKDGLIEHMSTKYENKFGVDKTYRCWYPE